MWQKVLDSLAEATYFMPVVVAAFTGLVAYYTASLKRVTRRYARVTERLLELNKEAFLVDVVTRTVDSATQMKISSHTAKYFEPYIKGVYGAIKSLDPVLGKDFKGCCEAWSKEQNEKDYSLYKDLLGIIEEKSGNLGKKS